MEDAQKENPLLSAEQVKKICHRRYNNDMDSYCCVVMQNILEQANKGNRQYTMRILYGILNDRQKEILVKEFIDKGFDVKDDKCSLIIKW